ncbi:MAG: tetratricopeptide repeat protein [Opitutaceae bacterium]|nr:tetratricopeptide repeat protein [Opitutaceae bacterium]
MNHTRHLFMSGAAAALLLIIAPLGAETSPSVDRAAALAAAQAGNWAQAEPALAALAAAEPADVEACTVLAQHKLDAKESKEAVRLLERATEAQPNRAALHALLGQALGQRIGEVTFIQQGLMSGKLRRAFARALELEPNNLTGLIGLAYYHLNAPAIAGGSNQKAIEYAARVAAVEPFNGALLQGDISARREEWAEAARHYRTALGFQPAHGWLQVKLGDALRGAGQNPEARQAYEAALLLSPELPAALEGIKRLAAVKE